VIGWRRAGGRGRGDDVIVMSYSHGLLVLLDDGADDDDDDDDDDGFVSLINTVTRSQPSSGQRVECQPPKATFQSR